MKIFGKISRALCPRGWVKGGEGWWKPVVCGPLVWVLSWQRVVVSMWLGEGRRGVVEAGSVRTASLSVKLAEHCVHVGWVMVGVGWGKPVVLGRRIVD